MKCPRDSQALVFVDDGRHLRDRCPRCEGVLLDRDEVASALGRGARQVELDVCPECNALWLDRGELDKIGRKKPAAKKAALVAGAAAAGVAVAMAATPEKHSGLGEAAADIAAEGAIDPAFEFAVEAIGALLS